MLAFELRMSTIHSVHLLRRFEDLNEDGQEYDGLHREVALALLDVVSVSIPKEGAVALKEEHRALLHRAMGLRVQIGRHEQHWIADVERFPVGTEVVLQAGFDTKLTAEQEAAFQNHHVKIGFPCR